jgi:hypothetical protein
MGMERTTFPGCFHTCHHACLIERHRHSPGDWLRCPGGRHALCEHRAPRDSCAPPPHPPLHLPDASPLQHLILDFQDAVAANTQPPCIWEAFGRLCALSQSFASEPFTRSSLERALAWAHARGEPGPQLIKFGWACLRLQLMERGVSPEATIGHLSWRPPSSYELPHAALGVPAPASWAAAAADAQYSGPLSPSAAATRVHGGLVAPPSLIAAPPSTPSARPLET